MAHLNLKDCSVSYQDDAETKDAVFKKIIDFFLEHQCFSGESVTQCDAPQIYAPHLLSTLADEIFKFDVKWKEE